MSDVPDEILREILSRLPVAPLLRFRCVSKSWKALIENQQFIKHHLNHSRKSNSNLHIIHNTYYSLYAVDFDLLNETNMAAFKELSHPFETTYGGTRVLDSCDGLLVLRNYWDDGTILWNPSVRRFHVIPFGGVEFPGSSNSWEYVVDGFGYDVVSDDYKLVRIFQYSGKGEDDFISTVNVYSLKSGSWRKIPDFPHYVKCERASVLVNGALHWIVGRERVWNTDSLVAAFDLGTEEYWLMPLPKLASYDFHMILGVVGGCLSVMYCNENESHIEAWVMNEYGVEESWSILFAFDISDFYRLKLIAYSECGRKVLLRLDMQFLAWYDLEKNSIEFPMIEMPGENNRGVHICLESLVLLNSFTEKIKEKKD